MNKQKAKNSKPSDPSEALIYVVDDEPMLLEFASVVLETPHHIVKTFRDAKSALEAFSDSSRPPDLVITDYAMHKMSGLELIAACRKLRPRQKVLLVSGTVEEQDIRDADEKPNQFLPKPYGSKQLLEAVETLLKS